MSEKKFSLGQGFVSRVTSESGESPSVIGTGRNPNALAQDVWLARYKQRFIDVAGLSAEQAQACAEAESFAVLSEWYEDDPEGAADMEMSYWDAD